MTAGRPRRVVVTGASSGIGAALALRFARHGDTVVAAARRAAHLETLARAIRNEGGACVPLRLDAADAASVEAAMNDRRASLRETDILINNAGVTAFKRFAATTVKEFDHIIGTNLRGLFLLTRKVLPGMIRRRHGVIINILSFASKVVYTDSAAYSASKAGAEAMMNVLRAEVRGRGVKVMNVFPGAVDTPMWSPGARRKYGSTMLSPDMVAEAVLEAANHGGVTMIEELVIRPQRGDLEV